MKAFPIFIEDSPWLEILESDIPSRGKMPSNGNNQNTCQEVNQSRKKIKTAKGNTKRSPGLE